MNAKKLFIGLQFLALLVSPMSEAETVDKKQADQTHPSYIGITGGYGSTTWQGLVPAKSNQGPGINLSTPIDATEGGGVWGVFAGYELSPFFAVEANYLKYPDATVTFDDFSLFAFDNNGLTELNTKTDTISLMAKVMVYIPRTNGIRFYSSIGGAGVHRNDFLINYWRFTPTFGVGITYNFTHRLMAELGGNYTAGYGESQLNPAEIYFPFLYSAFAKLALRF